MYVYVPSEKLSTYSVNVLKQTWKPYVEKTGNSNEATNNREMLHIGYIGDESKRNVSLYISTSLSTYPTGGLHPCSCHWLYSPVKVKAFSNWITFSWKPYNIFVFPQNAHFLSNVWAVAFHKSTNLKMGNHSNNLPVEKIYGDDGNLRFCPVMYEHRDISKGVCIVEQHRSRTRDLAIIPAEKYIMVLFITRTSIFVSNGHMDNNLKHKTAVTLGNECLWCTVFIKTYGSIALAVYVLIAMIKDKLFLWLNIYIHTESCLIRTSLRHAKSQVIISNRWLAAKAKALPHH